MIRAGANYHRFTLKEHFEPSWKDKVPRWSQLDGPAFALTEFFWSNQKLLQTPSMILLASPGASNVTDRRFVLADSLSPSLFVHTLPNIRCSPMCQVMEWSGTVIGIQNDPHTLLAGLREGLDFVSRENPLLWVLGVVSEKNESTVHCFEVGLPDKQKFRLTSEQEVRSSKFSDADLVRWFDSEDPVFRWFEFAVHREK
jgi:hypothetical protein